MARTGPAFTAGGLLAIDCVMRFSHRSKNRRLFAWRGDGRTLGRGSAGRRIVALPMCVGVREDGRVLSTRREAAISCARERLGAALVRFLALLCLSSTQPFLDSLGRQNSNRPHDATRSETRLWSAAVGLCRSRPMGRHYDDNLGECSSSSDVQPAYNSGCMYAQEPFSSGK